MKINVDASFQYETLLGANGAVAQDDRGDSIAAANWYIPIVTGVYSAELMAIRNALYLAANIGCNNVVLESDSSFVVDSMNQIQE